MNEQQIIENIQGNHFDALTQANKHQLESLLIELRNGLTLINDGYRHFTETTKEIISESYQYDPKPVEYKPTSTSFSELIGMKMSKEAMVAALLIKEAAEITRYQLTLKHNIQKYIKASDDRVKALKTLASLFTTQLNVQKIAIESLSQAISQHTTSSYDTRFFAHRESMAKLERTAQAQTTTPTEWLCTIL